MVKDQEYEGGCIEGCDRREYHLLLSAIGWKTLCLSKNKVGERVDVLKNELVIQVTEVWLL